MHYSVHLIRLQYDGTVSQLRLSLGLETIGLGLVAIKGFGLECVLVLKHWVLNASLLCTIIMHIIVCSGCAMLSHWPSRRLSRANIDSPQCRASRAASHDGRRPARCPCRQVPFMCQHGGRVYFREKMEQSAGRAIDTYFCGGIKCLRVVFSSLVSKKQSDARVSHLLATASD